MKKRLVWLWIRTVRMLFNKSMNGFYILKMKREKEFDDIKMWLNVISLNTKTIADIAKYFPELWKKWKADPWQGLLDWTAKIPVLVYKEKKDDCDTASYALYKLCEAYLKNRHGVFGFVKMYSFRYIENGFIYSVKHAHVMTVMIQQGHYYLCDYGIKEVKNFAEVKEHFAKNYIGKSADKKYVQVAEIPEWTI